MKRNLLTICCLAALTLTKAQTPELIWAKSFSGASKDNGTSIAVDASGNVYNTGTFQDVVDFDPGSEIYNLISTPTGNPDFVATDVFISKVDAAGNFLWAKNIGSNVGDYGWSIAVDTAGNVYTAGNFKGLADFDPGSAKFELAAEGSWDIFISKLDASGNFVWARSMGGTEFEAAISIALDGAGNIYTTGNFNGTTDFDPGSSTFYLTSAGVGDIFISKLNADGNFVWAKSIGGVSYDGGKSIKINESGNVYVTGYFTGTADFNPGTGVSNLVGFGNQDAFIIKLDADGNFNWAKNFGGNSSKVDGRSISLDASGNVYFTGDFSGKVDFDPGTGVFEKTASGILDTYISKLNASGEFVWTKILGGISADISGFSLVLDASANVYSTGNFAGTVDFDPGIGVTNLTSSSEADIFLSKLDASGNFKWASAMGGQFFDHANSIALDASNNIYITGAYIGTADFNPRPGVYNLNSTWSSSDIFVAKYGQTTGAIKESITLNNISFYPNPNQGILNIELNRGKYSEIKLEIINSMGQVVLVETISSAQASINIQHLSSGLYMIKAFHKNEIIDIERILKQ